jgi:hypothetical protein
MTGCAGYSCWDGAMGDMVGASTALLWAVRTLVPERSDHPIGPFHKGCMRVVAAFGNVGVFCPIIMAQVAGVSILIGGIGHNRWQCYYACSGCRYPIWPTKPTLRMCSASSRYPILTIILAIGAIMRDDRIVYVEPAVLRERIFLVRPLMCGDWGIRRNKGRTLSVEPGPVRSETSLKEARP